MSKRYSGGKVMSKTLTLIGVLLVSVVLLHSPASAKDPVLGGGVKRVLFRQEVEAINKVVEPLPQTVSRSTAQGTLWVGIWEFDSGPSCVPEGWVTVDRTAQTEWYFHVDNFSVMPAGFYALEGQQSLWCGADSELNDVCGGYWPGYGNNWDQTWETDNCLAATGEVALEFEMKWSTEAGYDKVFLEYDHCDNIWQNFPGYGAVYHGSGHAYITQYIPAALHGGNLRLRFRFDSDEMWSDEDSRIQSSGAAIIDRLIVRDGGVTLVPYENFEDEAVGDMTSDDWYASTPTPYGDFGGLYPGISTLQEDPCGADLTCVWTFFQGSVYDYSCRGQPQQQAVPYENQRGQYIANEIWSPWIPWSYGAGGSDVKLEFDVYRDLALTDLVFYTWSIRSRDFSCSDPWRNHSYIYYGNSKDWIRSIHSIGDLIPWWTDEIQISIGVVDLYGRWGANLGYPVPCHSQAPLVDNITLYRAPTEGPQWAVRDVETFQDNFPEDGTITGTGRADMGLDIHPVESSGILPGDSAVVRVDDPVNGVNYAYCYVTVTPTGQPTKTGAALSGDLTRYPWTGSITMAGSDWDIIRMYGYGGPEFSIDLNDNLFTPGDTIYFVYSAISADGGGTTTYFSHPIGQTHDANLAFENPMEFQILPGGGYLRGGDVLYVDGMNLRGSQQFFNSAFDRLGIRDLVDRYDIRDPSSLGSNRPGSRVKGISQLLQCYRKIIWDTGNMTAGVLGDGGAIGFDKSDDGNLLFSFLHGLQTTGGVYFSGDNIASWLDRYSIYYGGLRAYIPYVLVTDDHKQVGLGHTPLVIGDPGGCFYSPMGPDTLIAYSQCPRVSVAFDVIEEPGGGADAYYHHASTTGGAIVTNTTTNPNAQDVTVVLSGFSYYSIRDNRPPSGVPDRAVHLQHILNCLGNVVSDPVATGPDAYTNSLLQNRPNPFNPTTTIEYSIASRSHVSLKIYDVSGRLVRTLIDEVQSPGSVKSISWHGQNDSGQQVSSGVYFYRLEAGNFTQTRKMVLLK